LVSSVPIRTTVGRLLRASLVVAPPCLLFGPPAPAAVFDLPEGKYHRAWVTWLPVRTGKGPERDAVLGLVPEPYDVMRRVLTSAWRITDPGVLELCRCRLAQLTEARAELEGVDEDVLARLENWEAEAGLTGHERAALAFAEQYHYDHRLLVDGKLAELERFLSRRQLVNFVWALHMNDAYIRVISLLDIAPDPETAPRRIERVPSVSGPSSEDGGPDEGSVMSLVDPDFYDAYHELNPIVVRQSLVDEVTSEAVRLRNASHQGCLY